MSDSIMINGLNKSFKDFSLKNINVDMPKGFVTGIIGNNGAGKTTLLKCITGSYVPDSGKVSFPFEMRRGNIGMVFDECPFTGDATVSFISKLMGTLFEDWDRDRYRELCARFDIDQKKTVNKLSRGMRMKLQVAVALSHNTDVLIMDEPTAGMDPEARMDFLDLIREYISDGEHTVLISSHITSDLERIADYLIFIYDGEIILTGDRESLSDEYGMLRTGEDTVIPDEYIIYEERSSVGRTCFVREKNGLKEAYPELVIDDATLDDIMVYTIRGRRS